MTTSIERKSGIQQIVDGHVISAGKKIMINNQSVIFSVDGTVASILNVVDAKDHTSVSGSKYLRLTKGQGCNMNGYRVVRKD